MRVFFGIILLLISATVQSQGATQNNLAAIKDQRGTVQPPLVVNVLHKQKTDTASLEKTIRDIVNETREKPDPYAKEKMESDKELVKYTEQLACFTKWLVVATFFAVFVALFMPFYQDHKQNKNILLLIEKELDDTYSIFKQMEIWQDLQTNGQTYTALDQKTAWMVHLKLKIWSEFKYKLAVYSSKEFDKFNRLNDILERIADYKIKMTSDPDFKKAYAMEIEKNINLFISEYKKVNGL